MPIIKQIGRPAAAFGAQAGAGSALWTFPAVLGSAIIIAWAAEAAQFLVSQGLALAILAWLQTLPEFAVEAVIAWQAGQTARYSTDPSVILHSTSLISANFTGSLRLLVGLGWPMIYATAAYFHRRNTGTRLNQIVLDREHAVEVVFLLVCIGYFFVVWAKRGISLVDSVILACIYLVYLYFLKKIPPQDEEKLEDAASVPRFILAQPRPIRNSLIGGLFLFGGLLLYFSAPPFLGSLKALAAGLGISTFVFVQWVAPFLSEFPEKVSAFNWARRVTSAPLALMNMVSSNINQWTMLVAMIPIAYAISLGRTSGIQFDDHQRLEILLTLGQSLLGALLLANMRFSWREATVLFALWGIQFLMSGLEAPPYATEAPSALASDVSRWFGVGLEQVELIARRTKELITLLYFVWSALVIAISIIRRRGFEAITAFPRLMREHW